MATLLLRRLGREITGDPLVLLELVEDRRELWFWIPALMVAAAASEVDRGEGLGSSPLLILRLEESAA